LPFVWFFPPKGSPGQLPCAGAHEGREVQTKVMNEKRYGSGRISRSRKKNENIFKMPEKK